eukprot:380755-Lingulodinium_polyedra.AAC.1
MQSAGKTYAAKAKEMRDSGKSADTQRETMGPPAVHVWNSLILVASKESGSDTGREDEAVYRLLAKQGVEASG